MRLWGENDFETLIVGLEPWVEQALIPAFQPLMMTIAIINRKTTAEEIIGWTIEVPAMALSAREFIWEEVRMLINVFGLERQPLPASCAPVYWKRAAES